MYRGKQDVADSIRAIRAALDLGVNWIDTAPFYGWGRAEEIVGRAIKGRRDKVFVFTKCGTLQDGKGGSLENLKPESIRREVEASLRRLETDYIDLLQFHDPDPDTPIEESWAAMQELIRAGKVRHGGLSNHPSSLIQRAMTVGPVVSHQLQYSLLAREAEEETLPFAAKNSVGTLAWSPLASGFLTEEFELGSLDPADFRRRHPFAREPIASKVKQLRAALREIAARRGKKMQHAALAWVLRHPALTGAIIGIRTEQEAREMVEGLNWEWSEEELRFVATPPLPVGERAGG